MSDEYQLSRFISAQEAVYGQVLDELRAGHKRSHWMWFIFPQIKGLGFSLTARKYAISGLDEASAYLQHETLGTRLMECTGLVLQIENRSVHNIFGYPDDLKFRSSMTLFDQVAGENRLFEQALVKYFAGEADQKTLTLLATR